MSEREWLTHQVDLLVGKADRRARRHPKPDIPLAAWNSLLLELLDARAIEFLTASHAELIKKVNRAGFCHVPKLHEAFVGLQIGIQDFLGDLVGTFHHAFG
jgi:hypothetical protein